MCTMTWYEKHLKCIICILVPLKFNILLYSLIVFLHIYSIYIFTSSIYVLKPDDIMVFYLIIYVQIVVTCYHVGVHHLCMLVSVSRYRGKGILFPSYSGNVIEFYDDVDWQCLSNDSYWPMLSRRQEKKFIQITK